MLDALPTVNVFHVSEILGEVPLTKWRKLFTLGGPNDTNVRTRVGFEQLWENTSNEMPPLPQKFGYVGEEKIKGQKISHIPSILATESISLPVQMLGLLLQNQRTGQTGPLCTKGCSNLFVCQHEVGIEVVTAQYKLVPAVFDAGEQIEEEYSAWHLFCERLNPHKVLDREFRVFYPVA